MLRKQWKSCTQEACGNKYRCDEGVRRQNRAARLRRRDRRKDVKGKGQQPRETVQRLNQKSVADSRARRQSVKRKVIKVKNCFTEGEDFWKLYRKTKNLQCKGSCKTDSKPADCRKKCMTRKSGLAKEFNRYRRMHLSRFGKVFNTSTLNRRIKKKCIKRHCKSYKFGKCVSKTQNIA